MRQPRAASRSVTAQPASPAPITMACLSLAEVGAGGTALLVRISAAAAVAPVASGTRRATSISRLVAKPGWRSTSQPSPVRLRRTSPATREKAELAQVQSQYETFSKRKELLTARINVIEQLKAQQAGPLLLLNAVANSVSAQDTLWLTTFEKKAEKLTMNGTALSMKAVADLMTRLQNTKQFKTVDLKETTQNTGQADVDTFKFVLDLTMEPPVSPEPPPAAAPAPRARRGGKA